MIGSDINGVENRDVAIMPVDMAKIGLSLVELEGSLIGYEGKIAILSGTADSPDHNFWIAGMKEAIKTNPKYKNMEISTLVNIPLYKMASGTYNSVKCQIIGGCHER